MLVSVSGFSRLERTISGSRFKLERTSSRGGLCQLERANSREGLEFYASGILLEIALDDLKTDMEGVLSRAQFKELEPIFHKVAEIKIGPSESQWPEILNSTISLLTQELKEANDTSQTSRNVSLTTLVDSVVKSMDDCCSELESNSPSPTEFCLAAFDEIIPSIQDAEKTLDNDLRYILATWHQLACGKPIALYPNPKVKLASLLNYLPYLVASLHAYKQSE